MTTYVAAEISVAIEEQSATTVEISRSAQLAAENSRVVVADIVNLNKQADMTYVASNMALEATKNLVDLTRNARNNSDVFLRHIRSS